MAEERCYFAFRKSVRGGGQTPMYLSSLPIFFLNVILMHGCNSIASCKQIPKTRTFLYIITEKIKTELVVEPNPLTYNMLMSFAKTGPPEIQSLGFCGQRARFMGTSGSVISRNLEVRFDVNLYSFQRV